MTAPEREAPSIDTESVRRDFPILGRPVQGKRLVYLDNASSTQKPSCVIRAADDFYRESYANVHRGPYELSKTATDLMESSRRKVARFIGVDDSAEIIFTRNATEGFNLVSYAWGLANLKPGHEILISEMEHNANLIPWQILAQRTEARLRFIPVDLKTETLDLSNIDRLLSERTRLVSVTQMSNAVGTINPVREIARRAHAVGALCMVDGAQSVPHFPVDVKDLGCDFLSFSAHKMLGPTGVGVLWGRREILESMPPFLGGGDMIKDVWPDRATWNVLPHKYEAGTPNIAGIVAFGAALDYLETLGMENVRRHEIEMTQYALHALGEVPGISLYGVSETPLRGGVVSFNLQGVDSRDVGAMADREGIAIRVGNHCSPLLMARYGVPGTCRVSFYVYNDRSDIDSLVVALKKMWGSV
ncbi:MAG TPA: cysteine desulfurase [Elusimicrobiota bacterium]|nr:cysteine desulfurase [Elusimicrobiota bacterium]